MPQSKAVKYRDRVASTVSEMEERREDEKERYLCLRARF